MLAKLQVWLMGLMAFLFAGASFAVSVADDAVTAISGDGTAAITAVGGAMLGLAGLAIVFKWAKAAVFG